MTQRYKKTSPCDNCPFRTDVPPFVTKARAEDIVDGLHRGGEFYCHKTVTYEDTDEGEGETVRSGHEQMCAGAMIMLERSVGPNQMMRIAARLREYDASKLDQNAPVFSNGEEFIDAQPDA